MSEESEAAAAAAPWGSGHIRTRRRVAKFHPPGWIQELAGDLSQLRAPDCGGHEGMEGGQLDQLSLDTCRPPPSIAAAAADSADCSLRGRRRPRWLLSIVTRIHQQLQQQLVECAGGWALALALQSAGYTPARAGQGRGGVGAGDRIPDDGPTPAAAALLLLLLLKRLVRCQLPAPRPVTATSQLAWSQKPGHRQRLCRRHCPGYMHPRHVPVGASKLPCQCVGCSSHVLCSCHLPHHPDPCPYPYWTAQASECCSGPVDLLRLCCCCCSRGQLLRKY